jgi:hypothetical protein
LTVELTPEELEEIRADARAQVAKEMRKEAMKAAMDAALREERLAAGLDQPTSCEEMVDYTPEIPDNITPHACWTIDGRTYWHGVTYRVTKAQAQSFISMEARARENLAREQGRWFDPRKPNQGLRPVGGMPGMMLS